MQEQYGNETGNGAHVTAPLPQALAGPWNDDAVSADPRGWVNAMSCYAEDISGWERLLAPYHAKSPDPAPRLTNPMPKVIGIYFIGSEFGPIKIGISRDVARRLVTLQCGSPIPLRVLAVTNGGRDAEREYHQRFADFRLHSEWFSPAPEILAEITRLNAGEVA